MSTNFDCQTCGACCAAEHLGTVEVSHYDRTPREYTASLPGPWSNEITGQLQRGLRLMRRVGGRCAALPDDVGRHVSCAVYDRRPAICRRFTPGSDKCLGARALYRIDKRRAKTAC
ncbi:MAG: YkgJ family cysteine cluster protein [Blastocatellia bacterium]